MQDTYLSNFVKVILISFWFLFISFVLFTFFVLNASAEVVGACSGEWGSEFHCSSGNTNFIDSSYLSNASSFSFIPYRNDSPVPLHSYNNDGVDDIYLDFSYYSIYNTPIVVSLQVSNNGSSWVNATCDGTTEQGPITEDYNSSTQQYSTSYYYSCSHLDVTNDFSFIKVNVNSLSGTNVNFTWVYVSSFEYKEPNSCVASIDDSVNNIMQDVEDLLSFTGLNSGWNHYLSLILLNLSDMGVTVPSSFSGFSDFFSWYVTLFVKNFEASMDITKSILSALPTNMASFFLQKVINYSSLDTTLQTTMFNLEEIANNYSNYDDLDFSNFNYTYNVPANQFIWDSCISIINSHQKLSGFVITCMCLGVVALIMHRRGS